MFRIHVLWLLAAAAVCGQDRSPRKLIASMEGKDLFKAYCASCHGLDGKGHGPVAAALQGPLADLTTLAKRSGGAVPREEIESMILGGKGSRLAHGSEEMPVWGPVFRKVERDRDFGLLRVRSLVNYLVSLQAK
jgi:hypothetical protein